MTPFGVIAWFEGISLVSLFAQSFQVIIRKLRTNERTTWCSSTKHMQQKETSNKSHAGKGNRKTKIEKDENLNEKGKKSENFFLHNYELFTATAANYANCFCYNKIVQENDGNKQLPTASLSCHPKTFIKAPLAYKRWRWMRKQTNRMQFSLLFYFFLALVVTCVVRMKLKHVTSKLCMISDLLKEGVYTHSRTLTSTELNNNLLLCLFYLKGILGGRAAKSIWTANCQILNSFS